MLDTGVCHGMSVDQIKAEMPEEYKKFVADPFSYRHVECRRRVLTV